MAAEWFPDPNSPFQEKATVSGLVLYVRHSIPGFATWTIFNGAGKFVGGGWDTTVLGAKQRAVAAATGGR